MISRLAAIAFAITTGAASAFQTPHAPCSVATQLWCVAVDDASMGITTVIRAEEHLTILSDRD
jgi:glutamyl/glutaminyl-tRNA synthetase